MPIETEYPTTEVWRLVSLSRAAAEPKLNYMLIPSNSMPVLQILWRDKVVRAKIITGKGSMPECPYDIQTQQLSIYSSSSGCCKELLTQHIIPWLSVAFYSACTLHGSCVTDRIVDPFLHAAFRVYFFSCKTFSPLVTQPLLFGG